MTDFPPRRLGPTPSNPTPGNQVWIWPSSRSAQSGPMRIGDAERDRAVSALGDHYAAGRLTQEEFDERVDVAINAKFDRDLQPLFTDLPRPVEAVRPPSSGWSGPQAVPAILMWLGPLLLVATIVLSVALNAPWAIWGFFWVFMFTGLLGRRRFHHRPPFQR